MSVVRIGLWEARLAHQPYIPDNDEKVLKKQKKIVPKSDALFFQ